MEIEIGSGEKERERLTVAEDDIVATLGEHEELRDHGFLCVSEMRVFLESGPQLRQSK